MVAEGLLGKGFRLGLEFALGLLLCRLAEPLGLGECVYCFGLSASACALAAASSAFSDSSWL